jgi:2-methylcitrate dehydratase PrpD
MTFALEFARSLNSLARRPLERAEVDAARRSVIDTFGCALAGARERAPRLACRALDVGSAPGPCLVLGHPQRGTAADAAVVNGTAVHALDFDDCSTTMGGHPSAPVIAALLALGEQLHASGRDLLAAYVVGVETEAHLARGLLPVHYTKGWHPTATLGAFGAAAACGRLLRLDDNQLAGALTIAVSMVGGVKANFGTDAKPLHVGLAARNGLQAALLARESLSSNSAAFEQEQGFFQVFNGDGKYDITAILSGFDGPLELVDPGLSIKQHPCCGSAHSVIDAAIDLRKRHGPFGPDDIRSVVSITHQRRLAHTNKPHPQSGLDAKFSVQYLAARALLDGVILLEQFEGDAFRDPSVDSVMSRCVAKSHDESDTYLARLSVELSNGTVLQGQRSTPLGRGSHNPMSTDELHTKFLDCAARSLPRSMSDRLFEALLSLERVADVHELTTMMEA